MIVIAVLLPATLLTLWPLLREGRKRDRDLP